MLEACAEHREEVLHKVMIIKSDLSETTTQYLYGYFVAVPYNTSISTVPGHRFFLDLIGKFLHSTGRVDQL